MLKRAYIKIYGYVQGVSFRYSAKAKAEELGIRGWVRNFQDGSVQIEAEGENDKLKKFIVWCNHGPISARVEKVDSESGGRLKNFKEFIIKK